VACFQLTEDSVLERLLAETSSAAWLHDEVKRWLDIETRELLALQGVLAPFDLPPDMRKLRRNIQ
jgi:hypothetical protein